MEESKKYVEIEDYELARLYRIDGRVDALQEYIDKETYADIDVVLSIVGIDTTKMMLNKKKRDEELVAMKKGGESHEPIIN